MSASGEEAREAYLQSMVEGASREELLIMLLEGAEKFILKAEEAFKEEKWDKVHNELCRVQNIFVELMVSLEKGSGEFTENLIRIYGYINELLITANIDRDRESLEKAKGLIREVSGVWRDAVKLASGGSGENKERPKQNDEEPPEKRINLTG